MERCALYVIMPRQTVRIPLSSLPPYEAAAEFLSYIAFSDPKEEIQRYEYRIALSRFAITVRAISDGNWGATLQPIRPLIFSRTDRIFERILAEGNDRLHRRFVCAASIIMARLSTTRDAMVDAYVATIDNISRQLIARLLGYSRGSRATIISKIWAPTKPVAHAAAALIWTVIMDRPQSWHVEHPLLAKDLLLSTLFYPDVLESIIRISENLRVRLPRLKLRIRSEDTIRFIIT
jgi:hypothetical protein